MTIQGAAEYDGDDFPFPDEVEVPANVRAVFVLPLPISVNAMYKNVPKRGRVKTKAYEAWAKEAGQLIMAARQPRIKGEYSIILLAGKPDKRKRDLGNLEKALSDLLVTHGIVEDDSLAQSIYMKWVDGQSDCRVVIERAA